MATLPHLHVDRIQHGNRSRYVAGCRCAECRSANNRTYHDRVKRGREAVSDVPREPGSICPGYGGVPCPQARKLRRDSEGVCSRCRGVATWNGMVDAKPAREHMQKLSRMGVGRRAVSAASDVNETTLSRIRRGERTQIRKRTLERILAVDLAAASDHALIPAGETRRMLRELEPEYLTKKKLAEALGYRSYGTPNRKKITARNAHRIRKLHERSVGPCA